MVLNKDFKEVYLTMRTTYMPNAENVERKWYVVDAEGKTLGRLSSEIAKVLSGKNKPVYTSFIDTGDYVIVINAEKIAVTGKKLHDKLYTHHTGYIGGLKQVTLKRLLETKPERVIEHAVKGMLPKNTLGRNMMKKLHVYAGAEHPHTAQKPEVLEIKA
jgi:large subunit ribosomal protein L13